jgi:hypothetical protein
MYLLDNRTGPRRTKSDGYDFNDRDGVMWEETGVDRSLIMSIKGMADKPPDRE